MDDKTYTITELEAKTNINRRTIHYYTQQKLITPPVGMGGAAYYTEEHYLRLMLIRELQKSYLKLSGIREALDALSAEEMKDLLEKSRDARTAWTKESLDNWISPAEDGQCAPVRAEDIEAKNYSLRNIGKKATEGKSILPDLKRTPASCIWQRIEVAEGLEVMVRNDLASRYSAAIEEFIRNAKRQKKGE